MLFTSASIVAPLVASHSPRSCIFLSSLQIYMQEGQRVCVRACVGSHKVDTSLSVVLMVPLTTQQLLHISVVLAVGLKRTAETHTHRHTHSSLRMNTLKSAVTMRGVGCRLCPPRVPGLLSVSVMEEFKYNSCTHTPRLHLSPSWRRPCAHLRVSCQSSVTLLAH